MSANDNSRAILTGALFVALFVILLISLGRASHIMPLPNGPLSAVEERLLLR
jgi:hypothetical protein